MFNRSVDFKKSMNNVSSLIQTPSVRLKLCSVLFDNLNLLHSFGIQSFDFDDGVLLTPDAFAEFCHDLNLSDSVVPETRGMLHYSAFYVDGLRFFAAASDPYFSVMRG